MKNKIVVIDFGIFMFRAIFSWYKNKQVPPEYTTLNMIISSLRRIGINYEDKIFIAVDGRKSWRKQIDKEYKKSRKKFRESYDINWKDIFSRYDNLLKMIELGTNWYIVKEEHLEADDWCLKGNTYIASPLKVPGRRQISKIKKGDKVYSYNMKSNEIELSTVTKVYKRKVQELYKIEFKNGTKLKITGNHPLLKTNNKWLKAKNLKIGDEIYHLNSTQKNKYVIRNPNIRTSVRHYQLGYLCGAILGDGHFDKKRNRIEFNINDIDFVRRIKKYIKILFNYNMNYSIKIYKYPNKKTKQFRILIGNKFIYKTLFEYCQNIKSSKSPTFHKGFIAGFYDAEGGINYQRGQWYISMYNTNLPIIKLIQRKMKDFGLDFRLEKRFPFGIHKKIFYILTTNKKNNLKFFTLFRPAILRKYPSFLRFSIYLENGLKIKKIQKIKSKRQYIVYNLKTNPNNNYFANNLLVHNCSFVSRYYKNNEVIIVSYDADMEQLTYFDNVKVFSPLIKFRGGGGAYKIIKNPLKILAKKIEKEASDDLVNPILNEEDYEKRKMIVSLIELPEHIDKIMKDKIENLQEKEGDSEYIIYSNLKEKIDNLYNDREKLVTYEDSVKKYNRKKKVKKRRKQ